NDLAQDLLRYLHDEPVSACSPTAGYRLWKFVRRHRGPVLAAASMVLLLLSGITGTSVGLVHAQKARDDAILAERAERKAKETAERREAQVRTVLDFVESKIMAAARPFSEEGGLGSEVTLRDAVEAALPYLADDFKKQPLVEARLRLTLGYSFYYL